jgi:hypothetical protein
MLLMEQHHGAMKFINDFERLPPAAGTFVMNDLSVGIIMNAPPCLLYSITPINIFAIHKKILI